MINSSGLPYWEYSEAVAVAKETNEQVLELRMRSWYYTGADTEKKGRGRGG